MLKETYFYVDSDDKTEYYFQSEGPQGKIMKKIIFTSIEEDLWNLAFGDLKNGEIDDSVISNNHDIVRVFNTIAKMVYEFSNKYPTRHIKIEPVDEKRKRLYNNIFRRNYQDINDTFDIIGVIDNISEDYLPEKNYDIFKLNRKFVQ